MSYLANSFCVLIILDMHVSVSGVFFTCLLFRSTPKRQVSFVINGKLLYIERDLAHLFKGFTNEAN